MKVNHQFTLQFQAGCQAPESHEHGDTATVATMRNSDRYPHAVLLQL